MRRIKTYLRSTMGQSRLNAVMVLHIHKEKTDKTSVVDIANQFVDSGGSDHPEIYCPVVSFDLRCESGT